MKEGGVCCARLCDKYEIQVPKKSAGVASLRGQGTPAYPARLRSERARNSSKYFLPQVQETAREFFPPQGQKIIQEFLLPQGNESVASSTLRIFCRRNRSCDCEPGSGDFPSLSSLLFFLSSNEFISVDGSY